LAAAESSTVATVRELIDADRAYCLWFDDRDGTLRSPARGQGRRKAIAGIAGWAAHTGRATQTERSGADPRWLAPLDDPDGDDSSQLAVQPIVRADRRVLGVIVAARRARRPGFAELEVALLARFAALAAPHLEQL